MRKILALVCAILVCAGGYIAWDMTWKKEKAIEIRLAHASSEEATTHVVCKAFAEKAAELLGDRVSVKIFPNATLGSEAEMVEALQMGTLDGGTFGRHSAIDGRLEVLNLPFLFADDQHVKEVLRGQKGEEIRRMLNGIMEANGIVTLGWYETGFRVITSHKSIKSLKDLDGLLIRTPSSKTLVKAFQAWGAAPTAVDLAELYTALESNVVDAQENPYQLINTNKLYEVQEFLCVTQHLTIPNQLVFSKKVWETYPEDVRKALLDAGRYACDVGGELNLKSNSELKDKLSKKMTTTNMDGDSLSIMRQRAQESVWPDFVTDSNETHDLVDKIMALKD